MNLRRALFIAAFALAATTAPAAAQFQPQQTPPCFKAFAALRDKAEARGKAVMEAQKHKVPLGEACKRLTAFAAAQENMLKYAKANETWCGIPPELVKNIGLIHANISKARARICKMASAPPPPAAGPSLSDALGAPAPDRSNIHTGRGTFDTLTGTPLGR